MSRVPIIKHDTLLHSVPIKDRPRPTFVQQLGLLWFYGSFLIMILTLHAFQLVICLPLGLVLPNKYFRRLITFTKDCFGIILVVIVSKFGPSQLVLTAGQGIDLDKVCRVDDNGDVVGFNFDRQAVWIANHQQYADWIYAWILFFMADLGSGIIIILKASLRWAPIAMQLFQFVFLDKKHTLQQSNLLQVAKNAVAWNKPFQLLIFPEGTLVSRLTRPKSASFAKTAGIDDLKNMLLPRSTGLLYCLRTLSLAMDDLSLYDVTIGYEGVPAAGYAQDFFTLKTIFGLKTPPPQVHLHLRRYEVKDLPIGIVKRDRTKEQLEQDVTETDKTEFQEWTRSRWREKDDLLQTFYDTGRFESESSETNPVQGTSSNAVNVKRRKQQSKVVRIETRWRDWAKLASVPVALFVWAHQIGPNNMKWFSVAVLAMSNVMSTAIVAQNLPPNTQLAPASFEFGRNKTTASTALPSDKHPLHNDQPTYDFWGRQDHQEVKAQQGTMRIAQGTTAACPVYDDQTITVSVTFVVHYYSNPQGSKMRNHGYLSQWDINQGMTQLNKDFAQYKPRLKFQLSSTGVKYVLFNRIADWNNFVITPPATAEDYEVVQTIANTARGPANKRANGSMKELFVYTVKGISQGTIAFSYIPSSSTPFDVDGVFYNQDYWNRSPNDLARYYPHAFTHEVGHWLSLWHTFEGGCKAGNTATTGDFVTDTPPWDDVVDGRTKSCVAYSAYGYNYNTILNPCGRSKTEAINAIKNFMSYSYAKCMTTFTPLQRKRMWNAATKFRGFAPKCGKV
ncbi:hypothetical protein OIO90_002402 [Microbotryomycetes sp. JL221]|nr:hypothetical protein OIO90_002402 [Microbotryomycetes sp. JL221]